MKLSTRCQRFKKQHLAHFYLVPQKDWHRVSEIASIRRAKSFLEASRDSFITRFEQVSASRSKFTGVLAGPTLKRK